MKLKFFIIYTIAIAIVSIQAERMVVDPVTVERIVPEQFVRHDCAISSLAMQVASTPALRRK